ncbi:MAG TPA: zf-HC2 domain-containing protein [Acidobacteriaceae bacterium]|nr:zf-HC2 domain-containing protein [Acidobacteriaceae bacterium]
MSTNPLHRDAFHCSDEQLLFHADRELSLFQSLRVRAHLASCAQCRARGAKIEAAIAGLRIPSNASAIEVSGPRALLKARLAILSQDSQGNPRFNVRYARSVAYAFALILLVAGGFTFLRHQPSASSSAYNRMLPDPSFTPGATRAVALSDLCSAGSEDVVENIPGALQQKVFQEYGVRGVPASEFEVDYLITPGLGGSGDVRNLWPQPHFNLIWNSYVKDQLEDHLHDMVCSRQLSLGQAQQDIASNWITAYKKYFRTAQPLANPVQADLRGRVHFRALRRKQFAL